MQTNNQILLLRAAVSADRCIENINETYWNKCEIVIIELLFLFLVIYYSYIIILN
jgi:hypothetical protein